VKKKRNTKLKNKCASLVPLSVTGTWYRAVRPQFQATILSTGHTTTITSRFCSGSIAHSQFQTLYLTEDPIVALFEVQALLGSWHGVNVPNPNVFFTVISVKVKLTSIADLRDPAQLQHVGASIQELTGDWEGYALRSPTPPTSPPYYSDVPTHQLGYELNQVPYLEGLMTYSARVPDRKNLVIFPRNLDPSSSVECYDSAGNLIQQIP
jgi:hypothetical protein